LTVEDVVIIGAGPCGLSAAAEIQDKGFHPVIIEKENIVHSIACYPTHMQFFSTPELLEIAGIPFVTPHDKPYRIEALHYYRTVAERKNLRIRRYEKVTGVEKREDGLFAVHSVRRTGEERTTLAKAVVVATGYFDHPNRLGVPGEDLPHVSHFFREAHPYAGTRVVVIGGSNSAADAALELERVKAKVTVVYRGESVSANIKPWVRPLFDSLVSKGRIELRLNAHVTAISPDEVTVRCGGVTENIPCDFVLAMTGFKPDRGFLRAMGIHAPDGDSPPAYDPETMETNVPGLYLAGVVVSGKNANEVFIETGRFHGRKIAEHLARSRI